MKNTSHRGLLTIQMHPFHKWVSYALMIVVAISGIGYWLAADIWETDLGGARRMILVAHGVCSFLLLLAIGGAMAAHVRLAWTRHKGRIVGGLVVTGLIILIVSGLLLYYGSEESREYAKLTHLITGIILSLLFPAHIIWGRIKHR